MTGGARVIVCGGRDYGKTAEQRRKIFNALDWLASDSDLFGIWHGNASGADTVAGDWARERGVRCFPVPAEWSKYGKRAGPIRNQKMLGQGIDFVLAFPGGSGTADMIKRARAAGVEVIELKEWPA